MDVHKDCYSAINLTQQGGPHRRETDLLKDEGFEVIECATAEAAELIIASTGTELQALITDHNLPNLLNLPAADTRI
jgi:ABC-type lipopolysaccharide export system ATPase subunit